MDYIVRYLSAGEIKTAKVEARDAASAVAVVKMNRDQFAAFELLSVLAISFRVSSAETLITS